jgi:hypothetical protein
LSKIWPGNFAFLVLTDQIRDQVTINVFFAAFFRRRPRKLKAASIDVIHIEIRTPQNRYRESAGPLG